MRDQVLFTVLILVGCRTTNGETSNVAAAQQLIAADDVEEIRCDDGERVIEIRNVVLDGETTVGVIGFSGIGASFKTSASYTELKTVPVTYSWSFRGEDFSFEVNTKDNQAGVGVLVTGLDETTERADLSCVLKSAVTAAPLDGAEVSQPTQALDTSTVRSIACKGDNNADVRINDIGRLSEVEKSVALLTQKGVEILPDQFEINVSVREEESSPLQYVWTGAYRETFVEVTTLDMVSGIGVLFADAAGEIQRVELQCRFNE